MMMMIMMIAMMMKIDNETNAINSYNQDMLILQVSNCFLVLIV